MNLYITILAGGLGKRMKSDIPKVLHRVGGIPMIVRIVRESKKMNPYKIIVVVGKYYCEILKVLMDYNISDNITFAYQNDPLGTGDSVKSTLGILQKSSINIILNGDTPLILYDTLRKVYNNYVERGNKLQITAIHIPNPTGCGRIIKDSSNRFVKIVEEKDCNDEQKKITLVNCGVYIFDTGVLRKYVPLITNNNASNEYYLTDIVDIYKTETGKDVGLYELSRTKHNEMKNINTKEDLDRINKMLELYKSK